MVSTRSQTRQAPTDHTHPLDGPGSGTMVVPVAPLDPAIIEATAGLEATVREHLPTANLELIQRAVDFAIEAHGGVCRKSGEPYVVHPIEVAAILARMRLDSETVTAALLHDVVEDSGVESEELEKQFGERIARLVDGVTKLGRIPWTADSDSATRERTAQAESLRKMFLAMVDDIGVVLIKLADRLHNMRTLGAMPREKQIRISQQTMEIYAPLANRLGIWPIKSELEDLAFRYLQPNDYETLKRRLDERGRGHANYIERVMNELKSALQEAGIEAQLKGRGKHIYSIYRKMQQKRRSFEDIYDVIGIRILVDEKRDCYGALGVIHAMWHPIPGEFDDYIATPKESMYQSLHTAVVGPATRALEIQIRTHEMHEIAEYGVAAHWRYKEGTKSDARVEAKIAWLRQLMEWREEVKDAEEFVESLKSDVFQDQIYCFTPKGDIFELPSGATPIDFAYRVHTEVGHHCVGAKVNDQWVRLDTKLQNGQVVQILTSKTKGPSRDWLQEDAGYVTTAGAREKIRQWFRRQERDENIAQGRETLDRELRRLGLDHKPEELLKHFPRFTKVDDFLAAIGYGGVSPQSIASRLGENGARDLLAATPHVPKPNTPQRLTVTGVGDLLTNLAQCCKPVSGDPIVGYVTRGRGITVHRTDCLNVVNRPDPERLVPVSWGESSKDETFAVGIKLTAWDRVGLLKDISTLLADERVNILYVATTTHDDRTVTLDITLEVIDVGQLSRILHKLESIQYVFEVRRDTSGAAVPSGAATT
ncbi:MAG: diphosphokinase / guanosine-3,5-bis(diphosphate) 3-diphosphatase [Thermomicrobiales bacterium]|jgi:GTP pyrophosphokinase|nr:diphosphokinase / guanosine-3,5-bis(diphosphate) 3-diphosphatase [Thermomicrobiales bacterium]MEA2526744.1 diphosphokinase / guanosine-3,5-bis(diphosphate) 3-diphosphatase [Thermomicrobiales bacterium]MEA2529694.1 diphosphokinase / guanosine-3,5-bis(diphosphate) 3-diphosphatase [Thermomicrobiales bacterium]